MSSMVTPMTAESASMKRPVPAAHLSFITKVSMFSRSSREMALVSWPPMSRMVRTLSLLATKRVPSALALISLMVSRAREVTLRP